MSTFGSNLKESDAIKSTNRSRRVVSGSSGYGQSRSPRQQQPQIQHAGSRAPKFSQEAAQQGKIKAFINLDDIPDDGYGPRRVQYGDDDDDDDDNDNDYRRNESDGGAGKIRLGAAARKLLGDDDDGYSGNAYSSPVYHQQQRIIPKLQELRPMQAEHDVPYIRSKPAVTDRYL